MDALAFYGLQHDRGGDTWRLPVVREICSAFGALFGGCGLGASLAILEHVTGRRTVWATAPFLAVARPPDVVESEVTQLLLGHDMSQARVLAHVGGQEIFTVLSSLGTRELPWE